MKGYTADGLLKKSKRYATAFNLTTNLADYTYPLLMAQNALRLLYDAMQNNKKEEALAHAYDALAETKLICTLVKDAANKREA